MYIVMTGGMGGGANGEGKDVIRSTRANETHNRRI